jgi:omega-amidase
MQNVINIAMVQAQQFWEDKTKNLLHFTQLLKTVKDVDLIVLPEMFHTSFTMNADVLAESMEESMALNYLRQLATDKKAAIYTSFIVKEENKYFNRGVFMHPDGTYVFYDKRKTFTMAGESDVFSKGNQEVIIEYLGWKIQLQICFDLRFPEIVRNRLLGSKPAYDLILYVANWPERRATHWQSLLKARAIENQAYVVGVNRVGEDANGLTYSGDSMCVDLLGEVRSCAPHQEEVNVISLDAKHLSEWREKLAFLKEI